MYLNNWNNGFGDIWKDIMSPIKHVGGQIEQHIIRPIAAPISHVSTQIEKHVIRPTIGSKGIGRPLADAAKLIEQKVIRPTLGRAIAPIAKVMPKITIGGHRYDLGGHELLQKTATGAVAGTVTGGFPYGTIAGALSGAVAKGKPDVMKNLQGGAIAGAMVTVGNYISQYIPIPGTGGMSPADMLKAGASPDFVAQIQLAAAAPGGLANPANASLMPSIGQGITSVIPGTGMTGTQMLAAGASQSDVTSIQLAQSQIVQGTGGMSYGSMMDSGMSPSEIASFNASNGSQQLLAEVIPGTGEMTGADMLAHGATPQQVAEIQAAANAPGGLANPANASLMPHIGDPSSIITPIAKGSALTAADIAKGLSVASTAASTAQKWGLLGGKKNVPATTLPDGTIVPAHIEDVPLISNPYMWAIGFGVLTVTGLAIYRARR